MLDAKPGYQTKKFTQLEKFIIWLSYNHSNIQIEDIDTGVINKFKEAIKSKSKYCICIHKSKSVNRFWDVWHCTHCLKPKKNE
jgi:hypothetical protein